MDVSTLAANRHRRRTLIRSEAATLENVAPECAITRIQHIQLPNGKYS